MTFIKKNMLKPLFQAKNKIMGVINKDRPPPPKKKKKDKSKCHKYENSVARVEK